MAGDDQVNVSSFRTELDVSRYNLLDSLKQVKNKRGRSFFTQFREIFTNCILDSNFSFSEYRELLPPESISTTDLRFFVGQRGRLIMNRRINATLPSITSHIIDHKLLTARVIETQAPELKTPTTQMLFQTTGAALFSPHIEDPLQFAEFFRTRAQYPLFCKPLDGSHSLGAVSVLHYDHANDTLALLDGSNISVERFVSDVAREYPSGYLVQDRIDQHPTVQKLSGQTVSTIRVVTYRDKADVKVAYAYWKIAAPTAMADNAWRAGATIVALDSDCGVGWRAQIGNGPGARLTKIHEATGLPLIGVAPPHWDAARAAALRASSLFKDAPMMAWDIALGVDGPVLVEGNKNPNHFLYQRASGLGVRSTALGELEKRCAQESRLKAKDRSRQRLATFFSRVYNRSIGLVKRA